MKIVQALRVAITCAIALAIPPAALAAPINLVLNGDFEENAFTSTQFNLSNAAFNAGVPNAHAFGTAEEIDLPMNGAFGLLPQHGHWKAGLALKIGTGAPFDALSLLFSAPLVAGQAYELDLFLAGLAGRSPAHLSVGLSNVADDFGRHLDEFVGGSATDWTSFTRRFVADSDALYLTLRARGAPSDYTFVDNISLVALEVSVVPEPGVLALVAAALLLLALVQRARKPVR
jgi:hypothetical protein